MSRPLRLEFEGALYHVTSRGDRREPIFEDEIDCQAFAEVRGLAVSRISRLIKAGKAKGKIDPNPHEFVLLALAERIIVKSD